MHAELISTGTIVSNCLHNAFTSLCSWRGKYYLAYRAALSHNISPAGHIVVKTFNPEYARYGTVIDANEWEQESEAIAHPTGDCRDPKFIPAREALFLMCGVYMHAPQYTTFTGLSSASADNCIMTHVAYTTDGMTWSPLIPILALQHWGWSALPMDNGYLVASYVTNKAHEASSIVMWSGKSILSLVPHGAMYEGASVKKDDMRYRYPDTSPSEMVLYRPAPDTIGCFVRTASAMNIGVSPVTRFDWRWRRCNQEIFPRDDGTPEWFVNDDILHPSAIVQTSYGWVLAARRCKPVYKQLTGGPTSQRNIDHYAITTDLYAVHGQYVKHLLSLPSQGDCAYSGLAQGINEDEILVSYYSQHESFEQGEFGTTLPSANIYMAQVKISA